MDEMGWCCVILYCCEGDCPGGFFGRELVCADEGFWWYFRLPSPSGFCRLPFLLFFHSLQTVLQHFLQIPSFPPFHPFPPRQLSTLYLVPELNLGFSVW